MFYKKTFWLLCIFLYTCEAAVRSTVRKGVLTAGITNANLFVDASRSILFHSMFETENLVGATPVRARSSIDGAGSLNLAFASGITSTSKLNTAYNVVEFAVNSGATVQHLTLDTRGTGGASSTPLSVEVEASKSFVVLTQDRADTQATWDTDPSMAFLTAQLDTDGSHVRVEESGPSEQAKVNIQLVQYEQSDVSRGNAVFDAVDGTLKSVAIAVSASATESNTILLYTFRLEKTGSFFCAGFNTRYFSATLSWAGQVALVMERAVPSTCRAIVEWQTVTFLDGTQVWPLSILVGGSSTRAWTSLPAAVKSEATNAVPIMPHAESFSVKSDGAACYYSYFDRVAVTLNSTHATAQRDPFTLFIFGQCALTVHFYVVLFNDVVPKVPTSAPTRSPTAQPTMAPTILNMIDPVTFATTTSTAAMSSSSLSETVPMSTTIDSGATGPATATITTTSGDVSSRNLLPIESTVDSVFLDDVDPALIAGVSLVAFVLCVALILCVVVMWRRRVRANIMLRRSSREMSAARFLAINSLGGASTNHYHTPGASSKRGSRNVRGGGARTSFSSRRHSAQYGTIMAPSRHYGIVDDVGNVTLPSMGRTSRRRSQGGGGPPNATANVGGAAGAFGHYGPLHAIPMPPRSHF